MFEGRADSFEIWPYCALQTTVRMVPHSAIVLYKMMLSIVVLCGIKLIVAPCVLDFRCMPKLMKTLYRSSVSQNHSTHDSLTTIAIL